MNNKKKETPIEGHIRRLLEENKIEYIEKKKYPKLNNDIKKYRESDFYLTKYKIYIEVNGGWDNPERKEEYREKRKVLQNNNIRFTEFYPNDVKHLDINYFFRRIRNDLMKLKIKKILNNNYNKIYITSILILSILISYNIKLDFSIPDKLPMMCMFCFDNSINSQDIFVLLILIIITVFLGLLIRNIKKIK